MVRLILAALIALAPTAPAAADPAADAAAAVAEGVSWLHSFEYERALGAFERAERADPRTAMAYWGQAMCYQQLIWGNENVEAARSILSRLQRSGALARAGERERGLAATLDPLFGAGDRDARLAAYADAMAALAARFPGDADVAAFHGLALLATRTRGLAGAHPAVHGDHPLVGSREQEEAARIFTGILERHPTHPGALHYLIHAWDDPANAHKALAAARAYATVVPESSHARHMPAHVFLQLGMWDEAAASDEAAAAAAEARVTREGLPVTAMDVHPLSWLVYERTQQGDFDAARRALARLQGPAEVTRDPRLLSLLATLRSRIAVEEGNWTMLPGPSFANYEELFAVGFSAAHRGDLGLAERARSRLLEMAAQPRYAGRRALIEIMALQVGAALHARRDDVEGALALLADAAGRERALPAEIGPPALIKPAHEQYGELLLAHGRAPEAAAQFEAALGRARNRRLSALGLERARAGTDTASGSARGRVLAGGTGVMVLVLLAVAARRRRTRRT